MQAFPIRFKYKMREAGMNCRVKCEIEHMNYDILNGRKLNIKTIIKIDGKLTHELEQGIIRWT